MRPALMFPLDQVLQLAELTAAAADHASPVGAEADGPALLLVAERGICLRGNGIPPLFAEPGRDALDGVRAVYAEGYPAGTTWLERVHATGSQRALLVGLPLRQPTGRPLLDQLRDAATRGFDTFTIHPHLGQLSIGVTRRENTVAGG
jgi:hypothetical protein